MNAVCWKRSAANACRAGPCIRARPDGVWARIVEMLRDARTWSTLVYFVLMLPLGIAYFVTAVTALSLGLSFILLPIVGIAQRAGWWAPWESVGDITFSPAWLDTPGGWVISAVLGVIVSTALMHLARGVVRVHARTAKALLVTPA